MGRGLSGGGGGGVKEKSHPPERILVGDRAGVSAGSPAASCGVLMIGVSIVEVAAFGRPRPRPKKYSYYGLCVY